jgi:hypothetical protein
MATNWISGNKKTSPSGKNDGFFKFLGHVSPTFDDAGDLRLKKLQKSRKLILLP